jgi:hypothetical protein
MIAEMRGDILPFGRGVALLLLRVRQWHSRRTKGAEPELPKWMQMLDAVTPAKAAGLGTLSRPDGAP